MQANANQVCLFIFQKLKKHSCNFYMAILVLSEIQKYLLLKPRVAVNYNLTEVQKLILQLIQYLAFKHEGDA